MGVQISPVNSTNNFCIYSQVFITYCFFCPICVGVNKKVQIPLLGMGSENVSNRKDCSILIHSVHFFIVFLLKDEKSDVILHKVITIARHYISHKLFS